MLLPLLLLLHVFITYLLYRGALRGGHPRTAHYAKMSSKGRIELQIGVSGAEICEEPAGDVRFCVAPQKPIKNSEKLIFRPIFPKFSERVRVLPNASRRIQTHPNASEQVQAGQSKSENFKKSPKTCCIFYTCIRIFW